jgi:hypothetical protein
MYTTATAVQSPYGPLRFHPKARLLTYAAMKARADELMHDYQHTHNILRREGKTYTHMLQELYNETILKKGTTILMMEPSEPYQQRMR